MLNINTKYYINALLGVWRKKKRKKVQMTSCDYRILNFHIFFKRIFLFFMKIDCAAKLEKTPKVIKKCISDEIKHSDV